MTAPRHTPGPWSVAVNEDETFYEVQASEGELVAYLGGSSFPAEVDAANAALMAAAPDLAKSLSGAIEVIESCLKSAHDKTAEPLNQLTNDYVDCLPSWRAALGKAKAKA